MRLPRYHPMLKGRESTRAAVNFGELEETLDSAYAIIERKFNSLDKSVSGVQRPSTYNVNVILNYTDLQAAALNKSVTLYSLPAGYEHLRTEIRVPTLLGGIGRCGLSVGLPGDINTLQKYLLPFDASVYNLGFADTYDIPNLSAASAITLYAEADALLSGLSSGVLKICLHLEKSPF